MDKLSEKLTSRLLVQEEHGFQKGAQCAPPWPQELKKSLAWIGLKAIQRKSERGNFLVFHPVLLKIAYFNSGN